MTCKFCGRQTRGPWFYCDADCEADHEAELAAQTEPDTNQENDSTCTDLDDDDNPYFARLSIAN